MGTEDIKNCWRCGKPKDRQNDSVCRICRRQINSEWAKANRHKLRPVRAVYMRNYRKKISDARKDAQADNIIRLIEEARSQAKLKRLSLGIGTLIP